MYYDVVIAHHGIAKMKWGQRNGPPYPLKPASKSVKELKAEGKSRKEIRAIKKAARKNDPRHMSKKKRAEWEKTRQLTKEEHDEVVRRGDVKKASTRLGQFTDDELRQIKSRFESEKQISDLAKSSDGKSFVNDFVKNADSLKKVIDSGSNLYNSIAKVVNSTTTADLPIVGENKAEKIRKEKKEEADKLKKEAKEESDKKAKAAKEEEDRKIKREKEIEQRNAEIEKAKNDERRQEEKHIKEMALLDAQISKVNDEKYSKSKAEIDSAYERIKGSKIVL